MHTPKKEAPAVPNIADPITPVAKKEAQPLPDIEPAILESKAALATGGSDKADQQARYVEAVAHDTDQQNLDKEVETDDDERRPRAQVAEGKEIAKQTGLKTGVQQSKTVSTETVKEVKPKSKYAGTVTLGGKKINAISISTTQYGLNGPEVSVVIDGEGDEEDTPTLTLTAIPEGQVKRNE